MKTVNKSCSIESEKQELTFIKKQTYANFAESFWRSKYRMKTRRKLNFQNGEFLKGLSDIMELILFEHLYFETARSTFLLITFSFLIAEMVT